MDRIDRIMKHPLFQENLEKNREVESDRIFCRHDMAHFLDVARIARILALEEGLGIDVELIYAAALLHDIGKHRQYEAGTPHEQASAEIAPNILRDCGFDDKESGVIISAILSHRDAGITREASLNGILYRADKASRPCFVCDAAHACDWADDKKNLKVLY